MTNEIKHDVHTADAREWGGATHDYDIRLSAADLAELAEGCTLNASLLGDSQEREYQIAWLGEGEVHEQGEAVLASLAILAGDEDEETPEVIVYFHPCGEWSSLGAAQLRDTDPAPGFAPLTDERLNAAI
jgi:hypothetical protein